MRPEAPFQPDDLAELDERLFARASAVVAMETAHELGVDDTTLIAVRHDVDNVLPPALAFARWEAERGYRSTYFLLHSAPYWDAGGLPDAVAEMLELGHEIGIHNNTITEHLRTDRDPHEILDEAIATLVSLGATVRGTVAHGDRLCRERGFNNDEIFEECDRFNQELWLGGGPRRIGMVPVEKKPLSVHGLEYDSNWLHRRYYVSDSGGVWQGAVERLSGHDFDGQLHMLIHPCWWEEAFA